MRFAFPYGLYIVLNLLQNSHPVKNSRTCRKLEPVQTCGNRSVIFPMPLCLKKDVELHFSVYNELSLVVIVMESSVQKISENNNNNQQRNNNHWGVRAIGCHPVMKPAQEKGPAKDSH